MEMNRGSPGGEDQEGLSAAAAQCGPTPLLPSRFEFLLMSRSFAFVAAGQSKVKQGTERRRCERSDAGGKSDPSWEYIGNADCQRCSACQGSLGCALPDPSHCACEH